MFKIDDRIKIVWHNDYAGPFGNEWISDSATIIATLNDDDGVPGELTVELDHPDQVAVLEGKDNDDPQAERFFQLDTPGYETYPIDDEPQPQKFTR